MDDSAFILGSLKRAKVIASDFTNADLLCFEADCIAAFFAASYFCHSPSFDLSYEDVPVAESVGLLIAQFAFPLNVLDCESYVHLDLGVVAFRQVLLSTELVRHRLHSESGAAGTFSASPVSVSPTPHLSAASPTSVSSSVLCVDTFFPPPPSCAVAPSSISPIVESVIASSSLAGSASCSSSSILCRLACGTHPLIYPCTLGCAWTLSVTDTVLLELMLADDMSSYGWMDLEGFVEDCMVFVPQAGPHTAKTQYFFRSGHSLYSYVLTTQYLRHSFKKIKIKFL
jgi:hypothetical protein